MATIHYTKQELEALVGIFTQLQKTAALDSRKLAQIIKRFPAAPGRVFGKDALIAAYKKLAGTHGLEPPQERILAHLRMKPVRTQSGVAPVTVLTKPFPCPGKCIFCPNDVRMPKSYLSDEPGAQRAERNWFDPYLQTHNRLKALSAIGHTVDKAEIIVLGGTWSYYPPLYQVWFVRECFRALNEYGSREAEKSVRQIEERYKQMRQQLEAESHYAASNDPHENKAQTAAWKIAGSTLESSYNQTVSELYVAPERLGGFDAYQRATWEELTMEQQRNERATVRCVGLVVETRPDNISLAEVVRMRRLGCTKAQIGLQSLQDSVLTANHRGHDVAASRRAVRLLRQAGFKIHAHWMANLYGSNVQLDEQDYQTLFDDPDFRPDELKIYPCSLIESAELMQYHQRGLWQPYSHEELLEVVTFCLTHTPEYCRLTRVVRDIPSTDIVTGNTFTNFRQIAERALELQGKKSVDIRAREIKNRRFTLADLQLDVVTYETSCSHEEFIQFITSERDLVAFVRLSLPTAEPVLPELSDCAIIRELHVYGVVEGLQKDDAQGGPVDVTVKKPQHSGLGKRLLAEARRRAAEQGFAKIAVISAVGTREYYRKQGFSDGELYQWMSTKEE